MLKNLKLSTQIIGMVLILVVISAFLAVFAIVTMSNLGTHVSHIAHVEIPLTLKVSKIIEYQLQQEVLVHQTIESAQAQAQDVQRRDTRIATFHKLDRMVEEEVKAAEEMVEEARVDGMASAATRTAYSNILTTLTKIETFHDAFSRHAEEIFDLLQDRSIAAPSATPFGATTDPAAARREDIRHKVEALNAETEIFSEELDHLLTQVAALTQGSVAAAEAEEQAALTYQSIGSVLMVAFGLSLGIWIALSIRSRLRTVVAQVERVAQGDLGVQIDAAGRKDEIGQLNRALAHMMTNLRSIIQTVLTVSSNVAAGSMQLRSAAQQVSDGASNQASSVEETSAAMEEMAATIKQNAKNAAETETASNHVAEDAKKCTRSVTQTAGAMKGIADKIGVVDEITRKIDLLALNASVEAARAGEHGKGFAVVAAEVSKLADMSKQAAAEILQASEEGKEMAEATSQMLGELLPEIEKSRSLVQGISAASEEQTSGAVEINLAVQELDRVVQQNAAAAEEMTATAETLSLQGQDLKAAIQFFKLGPKGGEEGQNGRGRGSDRGSDEETDAPAGYRDHAYDLPPMGGQGSAYPGRRPAPLRSPYGTQGEGPLHEVESRDFKKY